MTGTWTKISACVKIVWDLVIVQSIAVIELANCPILTDDTIN